MEEQDKATETKTENTVKSQLDNGTKVLILSELTSFVKESTGLSIALAYLILILSSMAYLGIYFSAFDIEIIRFITLEDILATPIKNPDIILVFIVIFIFFYLSDVGNQLNSRPQQKSGEKRAWYIKALSIITWAPKVRQNSLKFTAIITLGVLTIYIFSFAYTASSKIREGEGSIVEITFADDEKPLRLTLLGTTTHFIFAYDLANEESLVFQVESIQSIRVVTSEQSPATLSSPSSNKNTQQSEKVQKSIEEQNSKDDDEKLPKTAEDDGSKKSI